MSLRGGVVGGASSPADPGAGRPGYAIIGAPLIGGKKAK